MIIDLWINWYRGKKPIPQKSVFSTACFQSEKKLPYVIFFLQGVIIINMDNFNYFNYKINEENNEFDLVGLQYRQLPWNIGIFSAYSKNEKNSHRGAFFCIPKSMVTTLFVSHQNDKYGSFYVINCKFTNKNNLFSHVDTQYCQIPWVIKIFSTHRKSEKKLPNGTFFLQPNFFGLNTFYMALWMNIWTNLCTQ